VVPEYSTFSSNARQFYGILKKGLEAAHSDDWAAMQDKATLLRAAAWDMPSTLEEVMALRRYQGVQEQAVLKMARAIVVIIENNEELRGFMATKAEVREVKARQVAILQERGTPEEMVAAAAATQWAGLQLQQATRGVTGAARQGLTAQLGRQMGVEGCGQKGVHGHFGDVGDAETTRLLGLLNDEQDRVLEVRAVVGEGVGRWVWGT